MVHIYHTFQCCDKVHLRTLCDFEKYTILSVTQATRKKIPSDYVILWYFIFYQDANKVS